MKKLLLTLILAVVSSSAMAEWVYVGDSSDSMMNYFADPTTIRKHGNTVKIWILYDYKETQKDSNRKPYRSYKDHYEYDCKEDLGRPRYQSFHSETMGGGDLIDVINLVGKWGPVAPDSIGAVLLEFACGK